MGEWMSGRRERKEETKEEEGKEGAASGDCELPLSGCVQASTIKDVAEWISIPRRRFH